MSKYIKKARSIARETSHQIHSVRDDMTKRQIQKERDKVPAHVYKGSNKDSYKFSDIGKWLDKDMDDESDDFFSSLNSEASNESQEPSVSNPPQPCPPSQSDTSSGPSPQPPSKSTFNHVPVDDLFDDADTDIFANGSNAFSDPLGLTSRTKTEDLFLEREVEAEGKAKENDREENNTNSSSTDQKTIIENEREDYAVSTAAAASGGHIGGETSTANERDDDHIKDDTSTSPTPDIISDTTEPILEEMVTPSDSVDNSNREIEKDEDDTPYNYYNGEQTQTVTSQEHHLEQSSGIDNKEKQTSTNNEKLLTFEEEDPLLDVSSSTKGEEDDELFKSFTSANVTTGSLREEEEEVKGSGGINDDDDDDELFMSIIPGNVSKELGKGEEKDGDNDQLFVSTDLITGSSGKKDKDDYDELFKPNTSLTEGEERKEVHKEKEKSKEKVGLGDSIELEAAEDHPLQNLNEEYEEYLYSLKVTPIAIPHPSLTPSTSLSPSPNSHPPPPPPQVNSSPENSTSSSPRGSKRPRPVRPPRPLASSLNRNIMESNIGIVVSSDSETSRSLDDAIKRKAISNDIGITRVSPASPPPGDNTALLSLSFCVFCLYLYYTLNPFVYLAGFLAGFLLFYVVFGSAFVLYVQYSEREKERRVMSSGGGKDRKQNLPTIDQLPGTIEVDFEKHRELKSKSFGFVNQYHPSSHHPSQRHPARVKLYNDYHLELRYKKLVQTQHDGPVTRDEVISKDLRSCSILLVPEEVAVNRKRRWSKKFPICITSPDDKNEGHLFLFTSTSREKEEWFRRLRSASNSIPYSQLVEEYTEFYRYMGLYMPDATNLSPLLTRSRQQPQQQNQHSTSSKQQKKGRQTHGSSGGSHKGGGGGVGGGKTELVRFSMTADSDQDDANDSALAVSITQKTPPDSSSVASSTSAGASVSTQRNGHSRPSSGIMTPHYPLSLSIGWINAGMARLAWDLWHEERWKNWVTSRIQRKLIRIKTPSFLEELKVTEVTMGTDMPIIKKPFKLPRLTQGGIWVYLEVMYNGSFTMTIETKLKLGPRINAPEPVAMHQFSPIGEFSPSPSPSPVPSLGESAYHHHHHYHHHKRMMRRHRVGGEGEEEEEEISSGSDDEAGDDDDDKSSVYSHSSTEERLQQDSEIQSIPPGSGNTDSTSGPPGRKEKLLNNMVSRFQKIAAKSRIVAKAAEKVSSYPLILTVEVKRLDGLLVLNMAPPPSDAIWYGFAENPKLELVATPKLGQREVTLSYVTDWIEKKLCEVVEKKLVLPNMEDLVVPLLSSGLDEDKMIKDKIPS